MASAAEPRSKMEKQESLSYAIQLVNSVALPMTLHAATELGVFDILATAGPDAKLSASEIAAQMPTQNKDAPMMLDRMLSLLASHSVVACSRVDSDKKYSLNPVSECFVTNQDGFSFGPVLALNQDKVFLDSWCQLKEAVVEGGIPFNRVHGMHAFEYPGLDPRFNEVFNKAMHNTINVIKSILEVYKGFENVKHLVDVGGGLGITLEAIISKYPHITGVNFDLPHVVQHAPHYPSVEHVGGDMFESVPKGDAIFMKWVLHDWSDEHCLRLLKNCYEAVPDDGKLIVVEAVLPDLPETDSASKATFLMDVLMMTQNPGGKERSRQEFTALATGAGFSGVRFDTFASNVWVMEFYKQ